MPPMLLRCLLLVCCVAASSSSEYERVSRGVRGRRRAYAIDEFEVFDHSGTMKGDDIQTQDITVNLELDTPAKDAKVTTSEQPNAVDFPLIRGQHYTGNSESGGFSDAAYFPEGSETSPPNADYGLSGSQGSFSKGKSNATLPSKGSKLPKGSKESKTSKKSHKLPLPKKESKSKAPHVAKKKLPLPKQASKKYMSKIGGSASRPTKNPAPSLRPPPVPPSKKVSKGTIPPSKKASKGTIPPSKKASKGTIPPSNKASKGTIPPSKKASKGTIPPSKKSSKGTEIPLAPFTISYSLDLTRIPMDVEIDQVVDHTESYLDEHFRLSFSSLETVTTNLGGQMLVSPIEPFIMNYTSVAVFSNGDHLPTQTSLNLELLKAFNGDGKDAYLEILQHRLNPMNIFSTTYDISLQLDASNGTKNDGILPGFDTGDPNATRNDEPSSGEENNNRTMIMAAAAAGAAAVGVMVCAAVVYIKRPRSDFVDNEKPNYLVCDGTIAETAVSATSAESVSEEHVPDSDSRECTTVGSVNDWTTPSIQTITDANYKRPQDNTIQSQPSCCAELPGQKDLPVYGAALPGPSRRRELHLDNPTGEEPVSATAITASMTPYDADSESTPLSAEIPSSDEPKRVADLIKMFSKS